MAPVSMLTMAVALLGASVQSHAACWAEAARSYGVSAQLLYAVARAESDLKPHAVNLSHKLRTGTYDIGLMQINSGHLSRLARSGISESDLYDPCTNVKVGASILAEMFARHGVSWEAVGAYNAACTQLKGQACLDARSRYAWRVYRRLPSVAANEVTLKSAITPRNLSPAPVFIIAARVSQ